APRDHRDWYRALSLRDALPIFAMRGQEFVEAAGAVGAGAPRILARHILPNILSPIIVMATLTVGFTIVETAGLSFLGLGASPPRSEEHTSELQSHLKLVFRLLL